MKLRSFSLILVFFFFTFSCRTRDPNRPVFNRYGEALLKAARAGDLESMQAASGMGADFNYQDPRNQDSALLLAELYNNQDDSHRPVIDYLLAKGAKNNLVNKVGLTAQVIKAGKTQGKFIPTIRVTTNSGNQKDFLLPDGCVSIKGYVEVAEEIPEDSRKWGYKEGDTKPLGSGSQGIAYLVYKKEDWSLWAPKFPKKALLDLENYTEALNRADLESFNKEDRDVMLSMKYGFGNPVEVLVQRTGDDQSLELHQEVEGVIQGVPFAMKSGITGGTLKEAIESGLFFYKTVEEAPSQAAFEKAKAMREELPKLFARMAWGLKIYPDLNPDNLMWKYKDPKEETLGEWVVIDAKEPYKPSRFSRAPTLYVYETCYKHNLDYFLQKLPVLQPGDNSFFTTVEGLWNAAISARDMARVGVLIRTDWNFPKYEEYRVIAQKWDAGAYLPELTEEKFNELAIYLRGLKDNSPASAPPLGEPADLGRLLVEKDGVSFEGVIKDSSYDLYRKVLLQIEEAFLDVYRTEAYGSVPEEIIARAKALRKKLLMLP